jgi:L-lactate utilization protein LutC
MSEARAEILGKIRDQLARTRLPATLERPSATHLQQGPPGERAARFQTILRQVGGQVERVSDLEAAAACLRELLAEVGASRLLVSDAPEARALAARLPAGVLRLPPDAPRSELLAADAGLSSAQWGVAETGTLVLESARERHRLASLLPPVHVALLRESGLLGTLGEALERIRAPSGAPASRTITLITGPSRTADIELELVVGVHGPKALHVLLLEDRT